MSVGGGPEGVGVDKTPLHGRGVGVPPVTDMQNERAGNNSTV